MKYVGENALKKWTSLVKSDIKKKLDKNQGTANSGKILGVDASGEVAPTDTEVATLVDVPNGIVKGDGSTLSAAVADMDYMAPPTGGTTGQILKKTETGTEWADVPQTVTILETTALLKGDGNGGVSAAVAGTDYVTPDGMNSAVAETKPFIVTFTYNGDYHADKTFEEIKAAYDAGKMCYASLYGNICLRGVITNSYVTFIAFDVWGSSESINTSMGFIRIYSDNSIVTNAIRNQPFITASGLLKGNGNGGVSAAVAGTDYMAPVTGGTAGQVLTKTSDGQEWQDREKDIFWATYEKTSAVEMTAAFLSGKMVVANKTNGFAYVYHAVGSGNTAKCFVIDLTLDSDNQLLAANQRYVTSSGWWSPTSMYFTPDVHASDHATGGSDPITPASIGAATMTEVNSAIQSAIQNTWEASY